MFQPMPGLLLALLVGTAAVAQPLSSVRERVERHVTLPTRQGEAVPEVHVAPGVVTLLLFDAPLERASVELEGRGSRFKLVDVGESALNLQPSAEWGPQERLGLRVRLKDGTVAALVLTPHPTQVDTRVDVARARTPEWLEAELARKSAELASLRAQCAGSGSAGLVPAGALDGLLGKPLGLPEAEGNASGLVVEAGIVYRANTWAGVALELRNLSGQKPWAPGRVRLSRAGGKQVQGVSAQMLNPTLAPGERGFLVVQTQAPDWKKGEVFHLELTDREGGRLLSIENVKL